MSVIMKGTVVFGVKVSEAFDMLRQASAKAAY